MPSVGVEEGLRVDVTVVGGHTLTGPFVKADAQFFSTDLLAGKADAPGGADVVAGHMYFHGRLNGGRSARGPYELPISFPGDVPQLG
ncbi:hypothetical protein [Amycolatopsis sp. NPDC051372]|uniref:hypothetical protein n=1 Tax=unclassified Amycolatopsis TaxID=2618356 RepID=UPI00342743AB